jgi:hypothetical protein
MLFFVFFSFWCAGSSLGRVRLSRGMRVSMATSYRHLVRVGFVEGEERATVRSTIRGVQPAGR